MGWRKIEKGGSMCVNFLCRSVLTFWGGKFSQKFGSESKATSAVSRELWHAAFCVFCLDWTLYFSKEWYRICLLPPGIKYKYMRQGPLPNMIKHCWVIDSKPVLCAVRIKKPTVPLFQNPNYQHATTVCKSQFQFGCKFEIIVSCHRFAPVICFVLFINLCWGLSVWCIDWTFSNMRPLHIINLIKNLFLSVFPRTLCAVRRKNWNIIGFVQIQSYIVTRILSPTLCNFVFTAPNDIKPANLGLPYDYSFKTSKMLGQEKDYQQLPVLVRVRPSGDVGFEQF